MREDGSEDPEWAAARDAAEAAIEPLRPFESFQATCWGCSRNHPSQRAHSCWCEADSALETYLVEVERRIQIELAVRQAAAAGAQLGSAGPTPAVPAPVGRGTAATGGGGGGSGCVPATGAHRV